MAAQDKSEQPFRVAQLLCYGGLGFPLALVALPLYVFLPKFYVDEYGLSLALIGGILLGTRLLDAFVDPALGWWLDKSRHTSGYRQQVLLASIPLGIGYIALFHAPLSSASSHMVAISLALSLTIVYLGYSWASITHQSWGAELSLVPRERLRLTATREGLGLTGVILGAALPQALGMSALSSLFILTLALSVWALVQRAPHPPLQPKADAPHPSASLLSSFLLPFRSHGFLWLFAVFVLNGTAAAMPATLVTFFVADVLRAEAQTGLFLVLYFLAGAACMPIWIRVAARWGQVPAWIVSMVLAVIAFVWAYGLEAGDVKAYAVVCILSGLALGADLALPPAMLAEIITQEQHKGQREGAYFGVWNFAAKLNLALAAGISLPLLGWLGYEPGSGQQSADTAALSLAYAALPCLIKLCAAAVLWLSPLKTRLKPR